jgi:hypothetical protein
LLLQKYIYSSDEISSLQNLEKIGVSTIKKYEKLPVNSDINANILLDTISGKIFTPGEHVSLINYFLNNNPIELVSSNTLVDGDILQEE